MENNLQETKSKVVAFVRRNGPVLPVQISKQIGSNIIFAGAIMSELVKNKRLIISNAKIGSSPVYYVDGQEFKLEMLYKHLNEKEKKAYDLLKKKRVLMDSKLDPWQRVALRDLKDFAKMLKTKDNEIFWKWHLLSNSQVEPIVMELLGKPKLKQEIKKPVNLEKPVEIKRQELKPKLEKPKVEKKPKRKTKKIVEDTSMENLTRYFIKKNAKILKYKIQ